MKRKVSKEWKERYDEIQRSGKHEKRMIFVVLYISKTSERERKLTTTNY